MGAVKRTHRAARERQQYQKMMSRILQSDPNVIEDLFEGLSRGLLEIVPEVIKAVEGLVRALESVTEAAVEAIERMKQDGTLDRLIEEAERKALEDCCGSDNLQLQEISGGTES